MLKIYCAGGWFSQNQDESLTLLEDTLRRIPYVLPYFPRHDGVKLTPGEFHQSELRKKVFEDNVHHIKDADVVVASCDGRDGFYDTGTQWEIGEANAHGIPVIAYDPTDNIYKILAAISKEFYSIVHDMQSLQDELLEFYCMKSNENSQATKVLFVGPTDTAEQREFNEDIISSVILECHGSNFRWIDDLSSDRISDSIDDIFADVQYMIAVIDDRHPIVSWMMGQAYHRNIPVITYTNFDYGVNIMLLCSLLYHCKGKDELKSIVQKIKRDGLHSLPKFDDTSMRAL